MTTRQTLAQRQAAWRKRRAQEIADLRAAHIRIRDGAKTIGEARKIAAEALDDTADQRTSE